MDSGRRVSAVLLVAAVELAAALRGSGTAAAWPGGKAECPARPVCHFTPDAASNYDLAERPDDGDSIRYIVIHDTEERYDRAIARFQDPGQPWDIPLPPARVPATPVVTIAPRFSTNREPVRSCVGDSCTDLPRQGSNVVYLHTGPSFAAPLIGDPALHPDGSPGTTRVADWSAKAVTGQSFVVAGRTGGWTAIWFGGRMAWFHDPLFQVSAPGHGPLITPRPGRLAIPVYGAAFPEAAAYPPAIPVTAVVPLQYTHRRAFVDADDVLILHCLTSSPVVRTMPAQARRSPYRIEGGCHL